PNFMTAAMENSSRRTTMTYSGTTKTSLSRSDWRNITTIEKLHQRDEEMIARRRNTERPAFAHHLAVQVIDLGGLAAREVLRGGRKLRGHGLRDAHRRLVHVARHLDARRARHGQAFVHHVAHHRGHAFALHQATIG